MFRNNDKYIYIATNNEFKLMLCVIVITFDFAIFIIAYFYLSPLVNKFHLKIPTRTCIAFWLKVFYYSAGVFETSGIPVDMIQYAVLGTGIINVIMTAISVRIYAILTCFLQYFNQENINHVNL